MNIMISKTSSEKVGTILERIVGSRDPKLFKDQVRNLSSSKETVLLLGLFVPPD